MKKILIGLTALNSLSAFAVEPSVVSAQLSMVEQLTNSRCEQQYKGVTESPLGVRDYVVFACKKAQPTDDVKYIYLKLSSSRDLKIGMSVQIELKECKSIQFGSQVFGSSVKCMQANF